MPFFAALHCSGRKEGAEVRTSNLLPPAARRLLLSILLKVFFASLSRVLGRSSLQERSSESVARDIERDDRA